MAKTSLAFFRKPQTLSSWRFERPKSLETVRQVVRDTLQELEFDVHCIEGEFYEGQSADENIKAIVGPVRRATRRLSVSYLHSASQIRELGRKCRIEEDLEEGIKADVQLVQEYHQRLCQVVPGAFGDIITDITDIRQCLEKYCLAFWEGQRDPLMESAMHYHQKRKDVQGAIDMHLLNINAMADSYGSVGGLQVSMFGITSNDLARRCGVGDLPFLLVFPEACQNIRSVLQALGSWVHDDEQYVTFLRNDISELEKKRRRQGQAQREAKASVVHWEKGIQLNKKQIKALKMELTKVRQRERVIDGEIDNLEKEIRFTELDIDAKSKEMEQSRKKGHPPEASEYLDRLTVEIAKLRFSIPSVQKQIEVQRTKKKSITERKEVIGRKTREVEEIKRHLAEGVGQVEANENELKRIEVCLQDLRRIVLRRTASDITKRIYHNLPIGPSSSTTRHDDLSEAILVTSEHVGSDWPTLYVELMNKVSHGKKTIEQDIKEINEEKYRATHRAQALRALRRWRRFDVIANVDALKSTLLTLRRKDLVQKIEERFAILAAEGQKQPPKAPPVVVNTKEAEEAASRFMVAKGPLRTQRTNNENIKL